VYITHIRFSANPPDVKGVDRKCGVENHARKMWYYSAANAGLVPLFKPLSWILPRCFLSHLVPHFQRYPRRVVDCLHLPLAQRNTYTHTDTKVHTKTYAIQRYTRFKFGNENMQCLSKSTRSERFTRLKEKIIPGFISRGNAWEQRSQTYLVFAVGTAF